MAGRENTARVKKRTMRLISLWLPEPMLRALEEIVEAGYFPSKSELIRFAIAEYIRDFRSTRLGEELRRKFLIGP